MRRHLRAPLLPAGSADLRCTLYPPRPQLDELKVKVVVLAVVAATIVGLIAIGQPVTTAIAIVAGVGYIAVEISTRLINPSAPAAMPGLPAPVDTER